MRQVVADASALAEYLFLTPRGKEIAPIVEAPDVVLSVPALCDVELLAATRRALLAGGMTGARARETLEDYLDLPLERHGHASLLSRALELHANFSAYDAMYVALAEVLGAELLTADARLARSVDAHTGVVLAR